MKKFTLTLLLPIFLLSCENEASVAPKVQTRDTTATLAAYMGYQAKAVHWGIAYRVTADSLAWVEKDSTSQVKKWTKVVYYLVSVPVRVDSAFASTFNVPLLDSAGKPRNEQLTLVLDKKFVRDGVTDLDSAVAELRKLYLVDTATKK